MLAGFPYIKMPAFTGGAVADVAALLLLNGRIKTYEHVKAVAETNVFIAERYGLDAGVCELCGYLHDVSAVVAPSDMLAYAAVNGWRVYEAEKRYPFLIHQRISEIIAERDFSITDARLLSAVGCHTTLRAEPSAYDMAVFVADKLAWDQEGTPPFYDAVNDALDISLEAASIAYMDYIVEHKMILHPHDWFNDGVRWLRGI